MEPLRRVAGSWRGLVAAVGMLLPLAVDPWGFRPFLPLKETLFLSLAALALLLAVAERLAAGGAGLFSRIDLVHRRLLLWAAVYWGWSLLVPLWTAHNRWLHLLGAAQLTAGFAFFLLVVAATAGPEEEARQWRWRIAWGFSAAGIVMALHALLQAWGLDPFELLPGRSVTAEGRWRAFTTMGNPNWTGEYLAVTFPLLLVTVRSRFRLFAPGRSRAVRLAEPIVWSVTFAAVVATGSRLALLALVAGGVILYAMQRGRQGVSAKGAGAGVRLRMVPVAVTILLGAALAAPFARTFLSRLGESEPLRGRLILGRAAVVLAGDAPILGHGLGHFDRLLPEGYRQFAPQNGPGFWMPNSLAAHAHNDALEAAVETGLVGLFLLGGLWSIAFLRVYRGHSGGQGDELGPAVGASLAVLLLLALASFPLHLPATAALFWAMVGLAATGPPETALPVSEGSRLRKIWQGGGAALAALFLAAGLLAAAGWHSIRVLEANRLAVRARDSLGQGKTGEAEELYRSTLLRTPWDRLSTVRWAGWLLEQNKPEEALAVMDEGERWFASREFWVLRARALEQLGKPEEALEALESATEVLPDYLRARNGLAELYLRLDRRKEARATYRRVLASPQRTSRAMELKQRALIALSRMSRDTTADTAERLNTPEE